MKPELKAKILAYNKAAKEKKEKAADLELVTTMRNEINKLNYKIKNMMSKLGDFEALEKEY